MAVYNIINKSKLERNNRIDGEYYHPRYEVLKKLYKKGTWKPIHEFTKKCEYGISIKMNEDGNGHQIFRMDDLKDGFVFDHDLKYAPITEETFENFKLQKNDILFNRVNSEEFVGRTGIFKLDGDFVPASYLIRLRTNSLLNPDFLNVFLNCKYGKLSIRRLARRAVNQANVNAQELQSILFPNLSPSFQQMISDLSNTSWRLYIDAKTKIFDAEKIILSEINYKKPSHMLTFSGNYTNLIKSHRIDAEYYQPKYATLRTHIKKHSNGFMKITDIATLSRMTVNLNDHPDEFINYVELANINHVIGSITKIQKIKSKYAPSRARMLLKKGATVVSSVEGSLNKVALVSPEYDKAIGSTGFFVFIPNKVSQGYLLGLLKSPIVREQLHCEASGTILTAVTPNNLQNIIVPKIAQDKQNQINSLVIESNDMWYQANSFFQIAKKILELVIETNEENTDGIYDLYMRVKPKLLKDKIPPSMKTWIFPK